MRIPRGLAAPVLAGCLALAGVVAVTPAASASAAELRPLPVPAVQYCAAVLGHVPGADAASQTLGRACSSDFGAAVLARGEGGFGAFGPSSPEG
ncbi:hypothetical protein [Streptomyces sp. CBMA156]|uniref:hypothetical protein n=1 Tax=Streptomyces sp. CBMA156 TaxID=1930280 RepID=UPI001661DB15|nr:hypothetical protein [Streptomyces sp. CBMA156]MBD0674294.1 hypothetical protein [Streptomyces sp. CBMA156]